MREQQTSCSNMPLLGTCLSAQNTYVQSGVEFCVLFRLNIYLYLTMYQYLLHSPLSVPNSPLNSTVNSCFVFCLLSLLVPQEKILPLLMTLCSCWHGCVPARARISS